MESPEQPTSPTPDPAPAPQPQPTPPSQPSQGERAASRMARQAGKLAFGPLVPAFVKTTPTNVRRHGS